MLLTRYNYPIRDHWLLRNKKKDSVVMEKTCIRSRRRKRAKPVNYDLK